MDKEVPINKAPSGSIVKVTKVSTGRLKDLGIMEGSVVKVLVAMPCGPVLVQREDGAVIVLDTDAASGTLVSVLTTQQVGGHKHRHRHRWGLFKRFPHGYID
jgi:ferrous iron transport protein A